MEQAAVTANAKINLTLDIKERRPDGYHKVEMVMQSIRLADIITIQKTGTYGIVLETDSRELPTDETNLAVKASKAFFAAAGCKNTGIRIKIEKRIPIAAGLAGGSADAAGVLTGLNAVFETGFTREGLRKTGLSVGADVPFCIEGSTMLARGVGENLTPLAPMPGCFLVIAKPNETVSTAEAYARFDRIGAKRRPDTESMLLALENGSIVQVASGLCNVFEEVMNLDSVGRIKSAMLESGALGAAMSGSGPSVFGLFEKRERAEGCSEALRKFCNEVFLCRPEKYGCRMIGFP